MSGFFRVMRSAILPMTVISVLGLGMAYADLAAAEPFQQTKNRSCSTIECKVVYDVVPAGKRLEVTSVSCLYIVQGGKARVSVAGLAILDGPVQQAADFLLAEFQGPGGLGRNYIAN